MERNFFEDQLNDIYTSVQDGNLDCFYALEEYLSDRGYREGFFGLEGEEGLESLDDESDCICLRY